MNVGHHDQTRTHEKARREEGYTHREQKQKKNERSMKGRTPGTTTTAGATRKMTSHIEDKD